MNGILPKISSVMDKLISPKLNSQLDIKRSGVFQKITASSDYTATRTAKNNDYKTPGSDWLILKNFGNLHVK